MNDEVDLDAVSRVRADLDRAGYTTEAVQQLLGHVAHEALSREELVPAERATRGGSPLETLVRLFLLGRTEPEAHRAIDVDAARELGLLDRTGTRALLDLRPHGDRHGDWWVVSDLGSAVRPGPLAPDHVLGVGGASATLAGMTVRPSVGTALDLGTGCGVQALHLSRHAHHVTATDTNPRALALAGLTLALNGLSAELEQGSLFEPVADRRFDQVVSNPPFVISPATTSRYAYRDSGVAGDALCRQLVRSAPDHLTDGGWCQLLANWLLVEGEDWRERVGNWLPDGVDAWVLQREVQDPAEYVSMWMRDAGDATTDAQQYDDWLSWFERQQAIGVGFGLITLRRSRLGTRRLEDLRQPLDLAAVGPEVEQWFARQDWLATADLLEARLRPAVGLELHQSAGLHDGWQVIHQALHQTAGLRWTEPTDPIAVDLVAGCDGRTRLGDLLDVLAAAYDASPEAMATGALPAVRHLVERGLLIPPSLT